MCPFLILVFLFKLFFLVVNVSSISIELKSNPTSNKIKLIEREEKQFTFVVKDAEFNNKYEKHLLLNVKNPDIAKIDKDLINLYELPKTNNEFNLSVKAQAFGITDLDVTYKETDFKNRSFSEKKIKTYEIVSTLYENQTLSTLFTVLVAVLVSLNTINMGCALDTSLVKSTLKRPTAIFIGLFTHYFFMPFFAFLIGKLLFKDVPYLQLSLFIFGCSPGGTAANMWTVLLKGNLNLSITMTFLSTLAAVAMMPLWLFTLGLQIFETNHIKIPYRNILTSLITMVFCIGVGLLIQKYLPKLANKSRRILAPASGFLIIFIVFFGTYCYWYLLKIITWNILLAATLNVWLGFLVGAVFALIFRQSIEDLVSIVVETGIQNTGIAYLIIRLALEAPQRDFAMTIPIAASCMTSIPLAIVYLISKCTKKNAIKSESNQVICDPEIIPINYKQKEQLQA